MAKSQALRNKLIKLLDTREMIDKAWLNVYDLNKLVPSPELRSTLASLESAIASINEAYGTMK